MDILLTIGRMHDTGAHNAQCLCVRQAGVHEAWYVLCSGVDIVGPSHVSTLFQSIPSYWAPMKKQLVHRVGDVENDQELNERISPYYHADKIKVPLLIGQGANDPRVKQAEADQIYNAMKVCNACVLVDGSLRCPSI